jgi:PAS domain S-box-containing protein
MQDLSKKYHALLEENALLKQQIQELEKSSSSHQALFAGSSKRAEDRLKETENKYKLLTDKMCDVGWISDMNLRTVFVTPSIQTVLGYSREERMGQTVDQQLTPDSLNRALTLLSRELDLEKQGPIDPDRILNIELEFYHQNGTTRWLDVIINGIRDRQGVLNGFHGVARDITDRKQAEDALKKAHEQLEMHVKERTQELANVIDTLTKHKHLLADESKRLQETNTALKVLLRQREEDQQDFERKVLANVRNLVLPYLEKIKSPP